MLKGEIMAELTLEVKNPSRLGMIYTPKFLLHSKDDGITYEKYGYSYKGLNRRIRKIIKRLNP